MTDLRLMNMNTETFQIADLHKRVLREALKPINADERPFDVLFLQAVRWSSGRGKSSSTYQYRPPRGNKSFGSFSKRGAILSLR